MLFTKVISALNEKGSEGAIPTGKSAVMKKLRTANDPKRDKLDFKAFYYAMDQIAARVYPSLKNNQAFIRLVSLVENVFKQASITIEFEGYKRQSPESWC